MSILFDQGTPAPLRQHLARHTIDMAFERGWSNWHNGVLLDVVEQEGYDLLITTDRNLRYQQNWLTGNSPLSFCFQHLGHVFNCGSMRYKLRLTAQRQVITKKFRFDEVVRNTVTWPNIYEAPGCQETNYPYERFFCFFRFFSGAVVTW